MEQDLIEQQSEVAPLEEMQPDPDIVLETAEEGIEADIIAEALSPDFSETFSIGGKTLVLSMDEDNMISACIEDECRLMGEGAETFQAIKSLMDVFNE